MAKKRMPRALAAYWAKKKRKRRTKRVAAGKPRRRSRRSAAPRAVHHRRRRSAGHGLAAFGLPTSAPSAVKTGIALLRAGAAGVGGAVLAGGARRLAAPMTKGHPIAEASVSFGTAAILGTAGVRFARKLPVVQPSDAVCASVGASMDGAFVVSQGARDAGKIRGVPGGRKGVLAGDPSAPRPWSGGDAVSDLLIR